MRRRPTGIRRWASAVCLGLTAGGLVALPTLALDGPDGDADGKAGAGAPPGTLQDGFAAAAREFGVPEPVLLAVGYEESRWDGHDGRPNTSGGYGVMSLTDVPAGTRRVPGSTAVLHTLATAARLTRTPADRLRADDTQNARGGAALLAAYERALAGRTPADPAAWYGAVARYGRAADPDGGRRFADDVYGVIRSGAARVTDSGQRVRLAARPLVRPRRGTGPAADPAARGAECPATVSCTVVPAARDAYQDADRPRDGLAIRYVVIHDTEGAYDTSVASFRHPRQGTSAHYVMRAADGAVTQMVPDRDVAFHAGNYWFNLHSIGVEHEGFGAEGATWYTEAQYRATADLVRYLARRYGVPLDREHVIGHDSVPGASSRTVAGMHWDPGPYWDWTHFMALLGAPAAPAGTGMPAPGTAVTVAPDYAGNPQTVRVCDHGGCRERRRPAAVLYVRTAPGADAPLFTDPALHGGRPARGTDAIGDWGDTVSAGQRFVVADRRGQWTAIWYDGAKVWFANPDGVNTAPAPGATVLSATGAAAPVYGQAYPAPVEYPADVPPTTPGPLRAYTVPHGQGYVADAPPMTADDFATDPPDTVVSGRARYWTVQYGHRVALLDAADVTAGRG